MQIPFRSHWHSLTKISSRGSDLSGIQNRPIERKCHSGNKRGFSAQACRMNDLHGRSAHCDDEKTRSGICTRVEYVLIE